MKDLLGEANVSELNTVIYLLRQVVYAMVDSMPPNSDCLNLLAGALLTRFSYTGEWEDVKVACCLRMKLGKGVRITHTLEEILAVLRDPVRETFNLRSSSMFRL